MCMSAQVPKSVYDNTKTERTKSSLKSKNYQTFTRSRVSTQPHLSNFLTHQPDESSVVVNVVLHFLHTFRTFPFTLICSSPDIDVL